MVRLHWIKVWDIKTEQVRDSFDSSGILFKAFWKRRLMCPIPGTAQKFPPSFISDSGPAATQSFGEAGASSVRGESRPFQSQNSLLSRLCLIHQLQGMDSPAGNLCVGDLCVILYPEKADFVCSVIATTSVLIKRGIQTSNWTAELSPCFSQALDFSNNTNLQFPSSPWAPKALMEALSDVLTQC